MTKGGVEENNKEAVSKVPKKLFLTAEFAKQ